MKESRRGKEIRKLGEMLCGILFPRRCPVCDGIVMPKGMLICPGCMRRLSWVSGPVCKSCGKEIPDAAAEYCPDCMRRRHSTDGGMALLNYNETAAHSMAQIKYRNRREYLDFYSEAMCRRLGPAIFRLGAELLIPVPVHPSRRRERGFNQSEELAKRLSVKLGIPMRTDILLRSRKTAPQKSLNPAQRLENLMHAFTSAPVPGNAGTILLVDDIYTTGSTIEACSRVLKRAGAQRVCFVCICIGGGERGILP